MTTVDEMLDNVFVEPEHVVIPVKKGRLSPSYRKRYQLLDYNDVTKLSKVMETTVPVHGKGNFPTLEITPSILVQMVREGLSKEGIRVPNVRLNGSAATHVLSEDGKHTYKDLDLIFGVDLSDNRCSCGATDFNNNRFHKAAGTKPSADKKNGIQRRVGPIAKAQRANPGTVSRSSSPSNLRPGNLPLGNDIDGLDAEIRACSPKSSEGGVSSYPTSPQTVLDKNVHGVEFSVEDVDSEDSVDKDSGYTSSGSSVSSLPVSPAGSWVYQPPVRSRTHSLDSSSSIASSSSQCAHRADSQTPRQKAEHCPDASFGRSSQHWKSSKSHEFCSTSKEDCWQKIKDVVMTILRKLLPVGVTRTRMNDAVLTDAYVQKMVKISSEMDRWSLISLNNNSGRNLELKFVETMRRQYEFSVDSFQIILDSYQRFKIVSRELEETDNVEISPLFYPSVLAESVFGDFAAALRHLRHRRICTHRPEEIRGGGLLRYCNLLVREFTPGEVEGYETECPILEDDPCLPTSVLPDGENSLHVTSLSTQEEAMVTSQSYSSSRAEDVRRLEQLMCSRFFIDFSEFPRQQQKLLSYLDSHFACEEDLKFQYLLIVRRVVDKNTVCLMSNERGLIIDYITGLAREALAKNVGAPQTNSSVTKRGQDPQFQSTYQARDASGPPGYQVYDNHSVAQRQVYPTATPTLFQNPYSANKNNNCNTGSAYYPPFTLSTVQQDYAPLKFYNPSPSGFCQPCYPVQNPDTTYYPPYPNNSIQTRLPVSICPCCRAVYPQMADPSQGEKYLQPPQCPPNPTRHSMSATSAPFYPASKMATSSAPPLVYLSESSKLFYNPVQLSELPEIEPSKPAPVDKPVTSPDHVDA